jgi:hypothetical protein
MNKFSSSFSLWPRVDDDDERQFELQTELDERRLKTRRNKKGKNRK